MLHTLKRLGRYSLFALLALVLLYAVGRPLEIWIDGFYSGERGPYLQMPAPTAITLRWQAAEPVHAEVRYGTDPRQLSQRRETGQLSEEHELRLSGLTPDTRYYYAIYHDGERVHGGEAYYFRTAPPTGEARPLRLWVIGDPGYAGPQQQKVRDAALAWLDRHQRTGLPALDVWLTTGDNAYTSGSNPQFQNAFFEPYAGLLRRQPIWPAYGNHDARRNVFFDIFTLPQNGESGGLASGTEHYYSIDYGNLHVIMLDTQAGDLGRESAMLDWLKQDLAATQQPWKIVVLHHPPYTRGSHDSDDIFDSDGRMFEVRRNVLPLLEKGGVQLVLAGHSHMYERSYPLRCHYGTSDSLRETMILSRQTAKGTVYSSRGIVYAVVGSSSKLDNGPLDHPALPVSLRAPGSMLIDIEAHRLSARFIDDQGVLQDTFVIRRGMGDAVNFSGGNAACR
ncbi:metallophosphoesterase family protein [Thiohalophilus sp.]|uniref:metallophosphoesterase family protein n=1 Tax=Thiohalophilus sp. TaxID=3028392 RepID=UPI002ACDFD05|nr:metallophosphoesterase family protein [Thiohalophilus sp.]MDZ7661005.1 metallophosphoesterase family protein [Thiohalophilus sp.]